MCQTIFKHLQVLGLLNLSVQSLISSGTMVLDEPCDTVCVCVCLCVSTDFGVWFSDPPFIKMLWAYEVSEKGRAWSVLPACGVDHALRLSPALPAAPWAQRNG